MDFYGKVKDILDPISGESANGHWTRQTIIVESFDNPMNFIAIDAMNERTQRLAGLTVNTAVKATFGINCRKGDKGYFTSLNLWDIQKL